MTIAIIGCGAVGSAIAEQLAKRGNINKIKLADSDVNKIKKHLNTLQKINPEIEYCAVQINAMNTEAVEIILKDVTVVINAASPVCNIPIMKACLISNTNYIDLASDPFEYPDIEGTSFDDQLRLHNEFLNKNLLALTNTGFSPGFTDILCKHVISRNSLDSLEYVKVALGERIYSNKLVVSWSPYILLLEAISQPTIYKKKEIVNVDSEQSSRTVTFPGPIGEIEVRIFSGHPELRTISDYVDIPIDCIEISGGYLLNNMNLNDIIVEALRKKVNETTFFEGDIFQILSTSFENPDNFIENYKNGIIKNEFTACVFEIKGKRNNENLEYHATIEHDLKEVIKTFSSGSVASFLVSFVPTIIAEKILFKEITEKGVLAPAGLSNASEIIEECKKMGLNFKESEKWY